MLQQFLLFSGFCFLWTLIDGSTERWFFKMKWEKNLNSWRKVDYVVMIFDAPPLLSKGELLILSCIRLQLNVVFLLPLVKKKEEDCSLDINFQNPDINFACPSEKCIFRLARISFLFAVNCERIFIFPKTWFDFTPFPHTHHPLHRSFHQE